MLNSSEANFATDLPGALALHPSVLPDIDAYAKIIGLIEDCLARESEGSLLISRQNMEAMIGPLNDAYAELMWEGVSIDNDDLAGLDVALVDALQAEASDEERAWERETLSALGLPDVIVGPMTDGQVEIVTKALKAKSAEQALALIAPLGLGHDRDAVLNAVKQQVEHDSLVEAKRQAMLEAIYADKDLESIFVEQTQVGWSSRDSAIKMLQTKIQALDKMGVTESDMGGMMDAMQAATHVEIMGKAWQQDNPLSKRAPGVEALLKVLQTVNSLQVLKASGIDKKDVNPQRLATMSRPATVQMMIAFPDGAHKLESRYPKAKWSWSDPSLPRDFRPLKSWNSSGNLLAQIEEEISGGAALSFGASQPKTDQEDSFCASMTVEFTADFGPLLVAAQEYTKDTSNNDARSALITISRNLKSKAKNKCMQRIMHRNQQASFDGYKNAMDSALDDTQMQVLDQDLAQLKSRMAACNIDMSADTPYPAKFEAARLGASDTASKKTKEGLRARSNWDLGQKKILALVQDTKHQLCLADLLEVNGMIGDGIDEHPGVIREVGEFSGTASPQTAYIHPAKVHSEMNELMAWVNEQLAQEKFNPIAVAAKAHMRFVSIHPFGDGNGRTSRLLVDFILQRTGLPASCMSKSNCNTAVFGSREHFGKGNYKDPMANAVKNIKSGINRALENLEKG
jgi:fido (protein-threonine AMPylation protein)